MARSAWLPRFGFQRPLLIACFPKSGSTFLARLLSAATGFPTRDLVVAFGHRDQDICERKLQRLKRRAVVQQHIKGTDHNVELIRNYGLRPIVLVRNIFDTVVSLDDYLLREGLRMPTGFVHREYPRIDFAERIEYLIRVHLPWYFNFFMSWRESSPTLDTFPLSYERLFADVRQTLIEIIEFHELRIDSQQIDAALTAVRSANTRFNKGVSGRGERLLTASHKAAIRELAASWRVDLDEMASIGLTHRPALRLVA